MPFEAKINIGAQWFNNRLNKSDQLLEPMLPKYTERQEVGKNPDDWDSSKFNISFFIASEHELGSIEENNAQLHYSQIDAI